MSSAAEAPTARLDYRRWCAAPAPLRWACLAGALGLIVLSSTSAVSPGGELPTLSWVYFSNLAHFPLYGLLGGFFALALRLPLPSARAFLRTLGFVLLVGYLDAWHQSTQAHRDASLWDLGTDVLAAALVLGAGVASQRPGGLLAAPAALGGVVVAALAWNWLPTLAPSAAPPLP